MLMVHHSAAPVAHFAAAIDTHHLVTNRLPQFYLFLICDCSTRRPYSLDAPTSARILSSIRT